MARYDHVRNIALAAAGFGALSLARRLIRGRSLDLRGKAVLITGGSRGLGLLLAREFAKSGCRIAICARDERELENARRDLESYGAEVFEKVCDVSRAEQVRELVAAVEARFGDIDILVNNASIIQVGPLETMSQDDFERAMAVNFWGTFHASFAALPRMRARRAGRIVNITSIGGKVAVPHLLPYSAAKFATVGLSEGMRAELAKDGIRVTTVVPGLMRTGSPVNAFFKGKAPLEFSWFSLGDSLRLTSMSAERAARRIVKATRRGESEVTLSVQAKALRLAHGLFPGALAGMLGLVNRLLPEAGDNGREERRGMDLRTEAAPSRWTKGMNRAAMRNNEYGGEPEPAPEHVREL